MWLSNVKQFRLIRLAVPFFFCMQQILFSVNLNTVVEFDLQLDLLNEEELFDMDHTPTPLDERKCGDELTGMEGQVLSNRRTQGAMWHSSKAAGCFAIFAFRAFYLSVVASCFYKLNFVNCYLHSLPNSGENTSAGDSKPHHTVTWSHGVIWKFIVRPHTCKCELHLERFSCAPLLQVYTVNPERLAEARSHLLSFNLYYTC